MTRTGVAGLAVSLLFGLWHFVIPYQFDWFGYVPDAPRAVVVSIDWVNFFFSWLLTGLSTVLLVFRREVFDTGFGRAVYGLLVSTLGRTGDRHRGAPVGVRGVRCSPPSWRCLCWCSRCSWPRWCAWSARGRRGRDGALAALGPAPV